MTRGHLHSNSSCLRPDYHVMFDYKEKNKVDVSWISDNYGSFFLYSLRIYFPPHSKYIVRADDEQVGLSMARTRQDRIMEPFCLFNEAYSIPIRFSIRSDFNAGLCGP